ncbi:unnamed protein product [Adineta steineri]|uniref:Uncharacterized protein n=2 Tax=Adineta steineri TaxID=433720 RepID=A0A813WVN4_9BILA|nr:unnamed protein product [Adineta steineri]
MVSFPNSSFFGSNLSRMKITDTNFELAQFDNTNVSDSLFDETSFTLANLHQVSFFSCEFKEANFSSAILVSVKFSHTSMFGADFRKAITNKADFASVDLSNSTFIGADIQGASFIGSDLNNVDLSDANLYKVDLTNAKITEKQLQSAISIHEALLPNGTFAHDRNFINNGQTDCNMSFSNNWILHKGNITAKISHIDPNNCYFFLRSYNIGAIMSRRVDLTKWDSESWPHSEVILSANMSIGVSIQLKVTNSTNDINTHPRLNSTGTNISFALKNDIRELEIFIEFNAVSGQSSAANYWCGDIKLFIIYGKYFKFLRVIPEIPLWIRWKQDGMRVAGSSEKGNATNQLDEPYNLFIVQDETMIIVERENDRVSQWKIGDKNGQVLAGGHGPGDKLNQLNRPSDVVIDKRTDSFIICSRDSRQVVRWSRHSGITQGESLINDISCRGLAIDDQEFLYVSDVREHVVRRYQMPNMNGFNVAGGYGEGRNASQLNMPTFIFVDQKQSVYVSDTKNHRVMKWEKDAKEGIVVAGGNGEGNGLSQLSFPNVVVVDTFDTVYVADVVNDRLMRWPKGAKEGTVIVGGKGQGSGPSQLNAPIGFSFDRRGNLYVADNQNHRIQRFSIE